MQVPVGGTAAWAPGVSLRVRVSASGCPAHEARLRIVRSGEVWKECSLPVPGEISFPVGKPPEGRRDFYRLELYGDAGRILCNPVFVTCDVP